MTVSPLLNQDQVETKVESLQGSEFSATQLHRACIAVLARQEPLRDAIVLREAKRLAELETDRSRQAWVRVASALKASVPASTFRLWIEPIEVRGEDQNTLLLTTPAGRLLWTGRHYRGLIEEALRDLTDFKRVRFVSAGGEG